jgi:hypothetical protein
MRHPSRTSRARLRLRLTHPPFPPLTPSFPPPHPSLQVLLGWIIIMQQQDDEYDMLFDEGELDEALTHFEQVVQHDHNDLQVGKGAHD